MDMKYSVVLNTLNTGDTGCSVWEHPHEVLQTIADAGYDGIDLEQLDRVVLDLPEPWRVVPHAALALRPGGIIVAYTPSILQAVEFRNALEAHGFELAETIEVLNRTWHIAGQAVRPDHRMVAHTGFLSHARLLGS